MTYPVLPPEINSARMFSGAGSAPMLDASTGWNSLASELGSAASSFSLLTTGLADQAWQGPASAAMTAAAAPYAAWLSAAEAKASAAAAQATAVADAFESALAATVHPLQVAANRNGLVQLVETNLFGQNAAAIAATEAQYEQMWAQDVAALTGYHAGASAAATSLPPWLQTLQQELTPSVALSVNGQAILQSGSATAYSSPGNYAIAIGKGSLASADYGTGNLAAAFGPLATAESGAIDLGGNNDVAVAVGSSGKALASDGSNDIAASFGNNITASASEGNNNDAVIFGSGGGQTEAIGGNNNLAAAVGNDITAVAGDNDNNIAIAIDAEPTSNGVLALGGNQTSVVTPFGTQTSL